MKCQLSLPWLAIQFQELPSDADVVNVQRYPHACILQSIGGIHCMFLQFIYDFDQAVVKRCGQINRSLYMLDMMTSLPVRCHSGQAVWTYAGPMICFHLVEKY
ncbi:serine/threonine-protein phosphatase 7 long form-like protein [Cucumis melo var. makuwa]|uniref:Serine/threonine-protein phosphatase 7 long form-like protein n=1 Tax=Cucumis melo var. makuwa TaxID=1194695 RepID=A0A5A7TKF5_CUCMM|nr:serine/threonine-protein phosphatase 7 long form-like protein [Cucumis melo var. makuwa]TYK25361.1 serine/threonine-protein phosphatase 7 long form-like protein [Cucumis melo var. makuwa]